jgi:hypothetical protein
MPFGQPGQSEATGISVVLDLTAAEIKHLWAFQDGAIMNPDVRQHLRKSWGFCPRHTWAAAVTEPALRWGLHGTVILYQDLTGLAAAAVRRPAVRNSTIARRLQARASCFTCDFLRIASDHEPEPRLVAARSRVNTRQRFTDLLLPVEPIWSERACPACLGGEGLVCRPHILAGAEVPGTLADGLTDLRDRMRLLSDSMRWHGPTPTVEDRSSWVEALGWFAGWDYPAAAVRSARLRRGEFSQR